MNAMILAAGFGTRLRPYSKFLPKPLFPVCNRPILFRVLHQIFEFMPCNIVVNAHYLSDDIERTLHHESKVFVQKERKILGTGGGVRKALASFSQDTLIIVNSDIFHTIDLHSIVKEHKKSGRMVSLVLHDYPRFNKIAIDPVSQRILSFDGDQGENLLAFTGIHVVEPEILCDIPLDTYVDIISFYRQLLARGISLTGLKVSGHYPLVTLIHVYGIIVWQH